MVGDYAAWDYFQSIDRPENREFVQRFKASNGADRVTSDVIEAAYNSVYLWAQAVREAESEEVTDVLKAHTATEPECAGGDRVGGRRDPAHLAARVHRPNSSRRPVRSGLESRKSRCGRSHILAHDRMRSGTLF